MHRRVKKKHIPPEPVKSSQKSTCLVSNDTEMKNLQIKLQKMHIDYSKVEEPSGAIFKIKKGKFLQGEGRVSREGLLAIGVDAGSVVFLTGSIDRTLPLQIFQQNNVPFGIIEISEDVPHSEKELVRVFPHEGYISKLSRIFLSSSETSGDRIEEFLPMTAAKKKLIGKLAVHAMLTPCRNYRIFLDEGIEFGMVCQDTEIMKHRTKVQTVPDSRFSDLRTAQDYFKRFFEKSASDSIGNAYLLLGQSGTGKSSFLKALRLMTQFVSTSVSHLSDLKSIQLFDENSPLIVFFDDIDCYLRVKEFPFIDRSYLLRNILDKWRKRRIVLFLTASDENQISEFLKSPSYIFEIVTLTKPQRAIERKKILESILSEHHALNIEEFIDEVATRTRGFSPRDLNNLCRTVSSSCVVKKRDMTLKEFDIALKNFQPYSMHVPGSRAEIPTVRWEDIGGQECAKKCLQECVKWLTTHANELRQFHVRPPRGILLHGPPGCSKTMLAKALANECNMHFIPIKGPELLSKWVGDSEKAIRNLFERARSMAPAVLFFDEFDALCGCRSGWSAGNRVISQMLHELDGFHPTEGEDSHILVVAATNRPDMIDPALLRPGRFDHKIHIAPPNLEDRKNILQKKLKDIRPEISEETVVQLGKETEGFSGADCVAVCSEASMLALQENIDSQTLTDVHLKKALQAFKSNRKSEWTDHV